MSFQGPFAHSQALFDAAIAEFISQGYEQASINTILNTAGMSKGQFYYHFQSKEGLYFAIIAVLIARKQEFMASVMRQEDFQKDLFTILETQIRHGLAFARSYPAIHQFAESFMRERSKPIYEKTLAKFNLQGDDSIGVLVERAHAKGELRTDLPLSFIKAIITFLFTHAIEAADLQSTVAVDEGLNHLIAVMRSGLGKRSIESEALK